MIGSVGAVSNDNIGIGGFPVGGVVVDVRAGNDGVEIIVFNSISFHCNTQHTIPSM